MKKLSYFIFIVLVFTGLACNTANKNEKANNGDTRLEATITELQESPEKYVGKKVAVEGIVTHVCRHEGQKMFITSTNSDERIKITCGEHDAGFDMELEGNTVKVTGTLKELRIDETYINNMETDIIEECAHEQKQLSEEEKAKLEGMDRVTALRAQLKESEKGYLSNLWIENIEFEVMGDKN